MQEAERRTRSAGLVRRPRGFQDHVAIESYERIEAHQLLRPVQ